MGRWGSLGDADEEVTPQKKKRKQDPAAAAAADIGDVSVRTPATAKRSGAPLRVPITHTLGSCVLPPICQSCTKTHVHGILAPFWWHYPLWHRPPGDELMQIEVGALNVHLLLQGILNAGGGGSAQRVRWADEGVDDAAGFSVGGASREQVAGGP